MRSEVRDAFIISDFHIFLFFSILNMLIGIEKILQADNKIKGK